MSYYEAYFQVNAYFSITGDLDKYSFEGSTPKYNMITNYDSIISTINSIIYQTGVVLERQDPLEFDFEVKFVITDLSTDSYIQLYLPTVLTKKGTFDSTNYQSENASNPNYGFPSFINIITSDNFGKKGIISNAQTNIVRFLSIYSYHGFQNIMNLPTNNIDDFYCGSSLKKTRCYYAGQDDTVDPKSQIYFNQWAKIVFELPIEADLIDNFQLIIPEIFIQGSEYEYKYRIEVGFYDKQSRIFTVQYTQDTSTFEAKTMIKSKITGDTVTNNKCDATDIQIVGQAGATAPQITLNIAVSDTFNNKDPIVSASIYGQASLIIITDWEFWLENQSEYAYINTADPKILDENLLPASLRYLDRKGQTRFAVVSIIKYNPGIIGRYRTIYFR
ncbi:hypothetical protein IMG5_150750 [Ichthyophthirius multifiliis]|uniref:Uncharacterized protein n=1 Tax=Ichthyophthirius multifiliis TaxID=5932 RepID=G0QYM3_ICHMU|nr:hypothetical protein IMG5_150750 [Ichthyophthirius multifiliis]EGR29679.1 hypothetical protein IMG5_150750 [Ichthyophthirius multifiliis]|eukprot:XP_004030915.1 hypothetical protein IMG5_150750 [Ichthyophthirius multifiliis]